MAAPTIYTTLVSGPLTIKHGNRLELSVTVSGTPPPDVVWYLNGRKVTETDDVTLTVQHKKYKFRIDHVTDDVRTVCVEASNHLGSENRFYTITVYKGRKY